MKNNLTLTFLLITFACLLAFTFFIQHFFLLIISLFFLILTILKQLNGFNKDKTNRSNKDDPCMNLETAKLVQEALLNIDTSEFKNIQIAKRCISANHLGGDFYSFINKNLETLKPDKNKPGILEFNKESQNIVDIIVGDVAGHGISSALIMALSSGILNRIGQNNSSPATILYKANNDIQKFIKESQISHVTAFYASINIDTKKIRFSNAGHPPAFILRSDNSIEPLNTGGVFLGMFDEENYENHDISINTNDRLFIFTDGIVEVTNSEQESFGTKRLQNLAIKHKEKNVDELLKIVFDELDNFRAKKEHKDDETLIIAEIL